ncbi:30S ribosomal protein S4 [soil metagenome]
MRYLGSKCKRCRAVGQSVCGRVKCAILRKPSPPGQHGAARKKKSDFALQLAEKQKIRWTYDVSERQFFAVYEEASKAKGVTGTIMLQILESRLDNIVFRSNLAGSRSHARQLINHGHVLLNGQKVTIASARTRMGDKIGIRDKSKAQLKDAHKASVMVPEWISAEEKAMEASITMIPTREQLDQTFNEHLVIEYYSR